MNPIPSSHRRYGRLLTLHEVASALGMEHEFVLRCSLAEAKTCASVLKSGSIVQTSGILLVSNTITYTRCSASRNVSPFVSHACGTSVMLQRFWCRRFREEGEFIRRVACSGVPVAFSVSKYQSSSKYMSDVSEVQLELADMMDLRFEVADFNWSISS